MILKCHRDRCAVEKVMTIKKVKLSRDSEILSLIESFNTLPLLKQLWEAFLTGKDILFTKSHIEVLDDIRNMYCLYLTNRLISHKTLIKQHNEAINTNTNTNEYKDQGFTTPTIAVLLPTKNSAFLFVEALWKTMKPIQINNKNRFISDFGSFNDQNLDEKPIDYRILFSGNTDDNFRLGIKIGIKNDSCSMKLFEDFYQSDIILASPLGLRTFLTASFSNTQDNQEMITNQAKRKADFLSSIELCIFDQMDMISMQNMDHAIFVLKLFNMIPKSSHDCDFSRIKSYFLDGKAKQYRQSLIFSRYIFPELQALFNNTELFENHLGYIKISKPIREEEGILNINPLHHVSFEYIQSTCLETASDDRYKYFTKNLLIKIHSTKHDHICIFISSYFDYVRIRNYFQQDEVLSFHFTTLHE